MSKTTLSVIKCDVGGLPGHVDVDPEVLNDGKLFLTSFCTPSEKWDKEVIESAREATLNKMEKLKKNLETNSKSNPKIYEKGLKLINAALSRYSKAQSSIIKDFFATDCGDDLEFIMTHEHGIPKEGTQEFNPVHNIADIGFRYASALGVYKKLYAAGQDVLSDAFSGNVRGMGYGVAEMEITERPSEPVVVFLMDKTEPGAFNLPIYRTFADEFNTAGLVIDPNLHDGFVFEIWDIWEHKKVLMRSPEERYDIVALIGAKGKYVIKRVFPKESSKLPSDEPVAVVSTEKLYQIKGEYVGKDDPVAIVRAQSGLPAIGEILNTYGDFPHLVSGWMRGSHNGPIVPCRIKDANCTYFDGPPRVVALGFQLNEGYLVGPKDLFDDPAFDLNRYKAMEIANYMRRHGPFEPHRLSLEEMEYTTLPHVLKKLEGRFESV